MPIVPPDDALRFLARISHTLYASLDYETILRTLARLCVPTLADWCGVDLLDESGKLHRVAVEHVDPERVRLGWELERRYPARPEEPAGAYAVARTGRSELMTEVPDELLVTGARDAEHLALLRALGLSSYLIAPIVAPEHRILGTLILATSNPDRRLDAGDLPLAEELGRRAGLAVDNALTHRAERAARAAAEAAAERSARLLEIASVLAGALTPDEVAAVIIERGLPLVGAQAGGIFTVEGDELVLLRTVGYDAKVVEPYRRVALGAPLPASDVVRTRTPILLDTRAERDAEYPGLRAVREQTGSGGIAAIPLMSHGEAIGVLALSFAREHPLSPAQRDFILTLAAQGAQALDRARLYAAEQRAAQATRESETRLRRVIESSMLGIAFWDGDRVTDCNDAYLSLLGYDRGDVRAGKLRLAQVTPPEYAAADQRALAEIEARGSSTPYEAELLRKDGTRVPVLIAGAALEGGGRISFVLDRTEHRLAEERIQASQRMEAVGRLAGGVAHEINNALQGVLGFSAFVRKGLAPDDPLLHDVEQIEHSGRRAASIAQQLLVFGRRQARHPVDLDLGQLVREFTPMLRQALGFERELVLHAPEQPVTVHADRAQLEQVLLNLALNARDAMPGGGRLSVSVSRYAASAGNPVRTVAGALPPGNFAVLEARDTGAGIEPALGANIFEPFFTTKSSGQGTGLGLAVVYGIVRQSGGFVSVDSKLGEGATFRIYFPETGAQPTTPAAAAPSESQRGHEVLLLVDDDPLILQVGTRLLSEAGYRVLAASSASEALEILADGHGAERPRLVITDVLMPGTGGRELGERIAHLHPEIPVLYMSGHANDAAPAAKVADRRADFIAKPVDPADLLERVRQILDAPHNRRAGDRARGT
ncbi:MAG TPA: GAF domain-containing protein [Gemmatimonadales bacterium]|nr:GAF domain-containing protein [Gemmatimonadales bacterium]